jgi:dTDP-4-dehydrorhamnose 3,5-epimerase
MNFIKTSISGAYIIERQPVSDLRGDFARVFCVEEFKSKGLEYNMVQSNISTTKKQGTIRGMHYQVEGSEEDKLVMCVKGIILDVILDARRTSATFGKHIKVELSEDNNRMLYVPKGVAHGYLTLQDNCTVFYQVSSFYNRDRERGIRWNDHFFNIDWPVDKPIISDKDSSYPDFKG